MSAEEVLQRYYKATRVSQPHLALELGVSQATVHHWLSGRRKIPMEHYVMIANICDVRLDEMLPGSWNEMLKRADSDGLQDFDLTRQDDS